MTDEAVKFCSTCGGVLSIDARFCAQCGATVETSAADVRQQAVAFEKGDNADTQLSNYRSKATMAAILIGMIAMAAAAIASVLTGSSSSTAVALVYEPGRKSVVGDVKYGDMYVVPLGNPYARDDRILSDVVPAGEFSEFLTALTETPRGQFDFEVEGGRLIAYLEEGDDDIVLAVVSGLEVTELVDGAGSLSVSRTLKGEVFATFTNDDRCSVYRIAGVEAVDQLGRAVRCQVVSSGAVMFTNPTPESTKIAVRGADGTETEFDLPLAPAAWGSPQLSPGGTLVAFVTGDPSTDEPVGGGILEIGTDSAITELRRPAYILAVVDSGALFRVSDENGLEVRSLPVFGRGVLLEAEDFVSAVADPGGTRAAVRGQSIAVDEAEYVIWDAVNGEVSESVTVDALASFNAYGWTWDGLAVVVSSGGEVLGIDEAGEERRLGTMSTGVGQGSVVNRSGFSGGSIS